MDAEDARTLQDMDLAAAQPKQGVLELWRRRVHENMGEDITVCRNVSFLSLHMFLYAHSFGHAFEDLRAYYTCMNPVKDNHECKQQTPAGALGWVNHRSRLDIARGMRTTRGSSAWAP